MLSIVINVKNGEKYLGRCLNALAKFDDVVVLDNYSTDKTVEIAKTYPNVRLFEHEFCGMGKVRNLAASLAKYDWVFFVDSDEVVHPKLANHLLKMKFENNCIYRVLRHNFYDNFRVETSSWGNDWILRLYNRSQTQFIENEVHDSFVMAGLSERKIQSGFIYHFPYENISQLIDKMQFYSTLYAKQHFTRKRPCLYSIPLRAFSMFIKCYFLKLGFLQGYEGLAISSFNAIGVFAKYIKLYELSYKRKLALAVGVVQTVDELIGLIDKINQQTLLPERVFILIDDALLETTNLHKLQQLVKESLVVPAQLIGEVDQDIATILNSCLINQSQLHNIVYVTNNQLLDNTKLFKQCKTAILKAKDLSYIEIFAN